MSMKHEYYDDLEAYIARLSPEEQMEVEAAGIALDISLLLYKARKNRSMSQATLAEILDMTQQGISRIEKAGGNVTFATVAKYLDGLDYELAMVVIDPETGEEVFRAHLHDLAVADQLAETPAD